MNKIPKYNVGDVLAFSDSKHYYTIINSYNGEYTVKNNISDIHRYRFSTFDDVSGYRKLSPLEKILRGING